MLTDTVTKLALVGSLLGLASMAMATPIVTPRSDSDVDLHAAQPVPDDVVASFFSDLIIEEGPLDSANGTTAADADPDANKNNPLLAKRADFCYESGWRIPPATVELWGNILQASSESFYFPGLW